MNVSPGKMKSGDGGLNLIDLPIDQARREKWQRGRERYGPVFVGDPLEELDEELPGASRRALARLPASDGLPRGGSRKKHKPSKMFPSPARSAATVEATEVHRAVGLGLLDNFYGHREALMLRRFGNDRVG